MSGTGHPSVVLLAHGSPDPRHAAGIDALADLVRQRHCGPVHTAFLDHHAPKVGDVAAVLPPGRPVVLIPVLLSQGYHWRVDLPNAAASLGPDVTITEVLDDPEALAEAALDVAAAHGWTGAVVLIDDQGRPRVVRPGLPGAPVGAVARTLCAGVLADRALEQAVAAGLTPIPGELARTQAVAGLVVQRITGNAVGARSG